MTHQILKNLFGQKLGCFEDIHAVYDFHKFTRAFLPKSADKHIKRMFAMEFEARDGRVFVRNMCSQTFVGVVEAVVEVKESVAAAALVRLEFGPGQFAMPRRC